MTDVNPPETLAAGLSDENRLKSETGNWKHFPRPTFFFVFF
jgi:phosphoglycerol transferase MdoB-like AlkP superfamily enzyme